MIHLPSLSVCVERSCTAARGRFLPTSPAAFMYSKKERMTENFKATVEALFF